MKMRLSRVAVNAARLLGIPTTPAAAQRRAQEMASALARQVWQLPGGPVPTAQPKSRPAPKVQPDGRETGTFDAALHASGGIVRRYRLYVPAKLAAAPALVVLLHGCTQDADDFAVGTRMNLAAAEEGFLVLYPEQSVHANAQRCWNWFNASEAGGAGEIAFLADLTRTVAEEHGVDPRRVFVAGLSAGGAMAAMLAAAHPELFAAAAVHSGLPVGAAENLTGALSAMARGASRGRATTVPTIVLHGDADRTVHPDNGDRLVEALMGDAPAATRRTEAPAYTRTEYLDEAGDVRAEHWTLHGAGHAWAGGDAAGSYTDPNGVDATRAILAFFATHPGRSSGTAHGAHAAPGSRAAGDGWPPGTAAIGR